MERSTASLAIDRIVRAERAARSQNTLIGILILWNIGLTFAVGILILGRIL